MKVTVVLWQQFLNAVNGLPDAYPLNIKLYPLR